MNKTYNKFLIPLAIMLLLGGMYAYFSNELNVSAAAAPESALSSNAPASVGSGDNKIVLDTAFLTSLTSLTRLKIDTKIFKDRAFTSLKDNTVKLELVSVVGRSNPFAPINATFTNAIPTGSTVVTNQATDITSRSAVFNGTVNSTGGVTSTYFEYGPTPLMDKATPSVKQSLISTFVATVNNLAPKTTYYYRAAVIINGKNLFGDTLSFTTN